MLFLRTGSLALVGSLASAQYLTRTGTHARTRPFTVWLRPERDWRPDPDTMRRAKKREKSRGDRLGTAAPAVRLASASTPGSGMAAVNSPAPSSSVLASFSLTSSPGLHPRRRACPLRLCTRPPRTSTPGGAGRLLWRGWHILARHAQMCPTTCPPRWLVDVPDSPLLRARKCSGAKKKACPESEGSRRAQQGARCPERGLPHPKRYPGSTMRERFVVKAGQTVEIILLQ